MSIVKQLALVAIALATTIPGLKAATQAPMKVDGRGLVEIPGVLRNYSGFHWGAMNLVAFGRGWSYSAQDYALKNVAKGSNSLHADFIVGGKALDFSEGWDFASKRSDGTPAAKILWTLASKDLTSMDLEQAFIRIPLGISDFVGGMVRTDSGFTATLPPAIDKANILSLFGGRELIITAKDSTGRDVVLRITAANLSAEVVDARTENSGKGPEAYWIKLYLPNVKNSAKSQLEVWISVDYPNEAAPPPPPEYKTAVNNNWAEFNFTPRVQDGTILDLSFIHKAEAPAGRYGRIVIDSDGHYSFENTGKRVRLMGANLCYDANTMPHKWADYVVEDMVRMGYNALRIHHTDVTLTKDVWKDLWTRTTISPIDTNALERLDYLFAKAKNAGLYITIDLYAMGNLGSVTLNGKKVPLNSNNAKALIPICDEAFDAWAARALEWMNHVNPYTGIKWKDDPALVTICPVNEDSIESVWHGAKALYEEKFAEWKSSSAAPLGRSDAQLRAQFLTEFKVAANAKFEKFFRDNGIKALISGCNWWNNMSEAFERDSLEVVDNHQYADHPQPGFHSMPCRFNHKSTIKEGNPTYMVPVMMAASRIWGKPFVSTEWNFCYPNKYRVEGGIMMGGIAGLQDWDGIYRFAWSHSSENITHVPHPINGFDIVTDPVSLITERLSVLLFGRSDMPAAHKKYVYAVSMEEATQDGIGDMWSKGLFPHNFNALALESQIGSVVMKIGRSLKSGFETVFAAEAPCDDEFLGGNVFRKKTELPNFKNKSQHYCADNGAMRLDSSAGIAYIDTERTDAIVTPENAQTIESGALTIKSASTFCMVSATSMDNATLEKSSRVLVMFMTDVNNTGMVFAEPSHTTLKSHGHLPYLVRKGTADVSLANARSDMKIYQIAPDGTRTGRVIQSQYNNGAYHFRVKLGENISDTPFYEIAP